MNIAYINKKSNRKFLSFRPKTFTFPTGNKLFLFDKTPFCGILKKYSDIMIKSSVSQEFANEVYLKVIKQILNEENPNKIVFAFENAFNQINLLQKIIDEKIDFYLSDSPGAADVVDFFLKKNGIPIKTTEYIFPYTTIYFGGELPECNEIINLSGSRINGTSEIVEFTIRGIDFPVAIDSLPLLEAALMLVEKDISSIIVKFGINNETGE